GVDVSSELHGEGRDPAQVVGLGIGDDVDVLGAADDAPGVECEPADEHEPHLGGDELAQQLVEGRPGHFRRAAPAKPMSLWLSAMPSARFTLMCRAASRLMRARRAASLPDSLVFFDVTG